MRSDEYESDDRVRSVRLVNVADFEDVQDSSTGRVDHWVGERGVSVASYSL
jgi:hypothetical protein